MPLKVTNNAFATLAAGISNSATSITVASGQGARFPTLSAGDYFYATLIDTSNNLEIVKVTARATDTMTVVRAQDGTTARAYNVNDRFELRPTAALFNEKANVDDLGTAAAADVVTSDTDVTAGRLLTTAAGPAQAFRRGNILGTVSQSGGVPTGAIIERGSNANGQFVKYADGTMICTRVFIVNDTINTSWGNIFISNLFIPRAFPATFAAVPATSIMPANRGIFSFWIVYGDTPPTTTAWMTFYLARGTSDSTSRSTTMHAIAIGRWY